MQKRIGLALSGGGVRAMAFHAGVLEWLASRELLEGVGAVSTVSGGTLVTGLVLRLNDWKWPSSEEYQAHVLPRLREALTTVCLEREVWKLLLTKPKNWRYAFSRANVLAIAIERSWGINASLDSAVSSFEWSLNGTAAETGRRFRFKQGRCGDHQTGYASSASFGLAEAMAASAAYPILIGPYRIDASRMQWFKRPTWGGSASDEKPVPPPYQTLHIIDGGLYDNLGMEPVFDVGAQSLKSDIDHLIVSDAGAAFRQQALPSQWRLGRLSRILEISMDQTRALRVRPFVNAILKKPSLGRYYQIGSDPRAMIAKHLKAPEIATANTWLSDSEVKRASVWPTDLKKLDSGTFDLIARHGFETAEWNEILFAERAENSN
jgi:NTE family protein